MDLTEDEVLEILKLIESSDFDFFELEHGDLKLTVSKDGYVISGSDNTPIAAREAGDPAPVPAPSVGQPEPAASAPTRDDPAIPEGMVPVVAPMVGTFYAAPDPEAPPFIEKGARVDDETTVGLIEVMKVFTSVAAKSRGVVREVLVSNAQFVEYGQVLFIIEPDGGGEAGE